MDPKQHKQITDRYKQTYGLVLSTREVMGRLIGTLILNVEQAKGAHSQRRLDTMFEFNRKSLRILGAIRASLEKENIDKNEQAGVQLLACLRLLYRDIFIRLANVLRAPNPQAEFDLLLSHLRRQYQAWSGNVKALDKAPEANNATQTISKQETPYREKPARVTASFYT